MIIILHSATTKTVGETMRLDLEDAFKGRLEIILADADDPSVVSRATSWDDVLVVVFDEVPIGWMVDSQYLFFSFEFLIFSCQEPVITKN